MENEFVIPTMHGMSCDEFRAITKKKEKFQPITVKPGLESKENKQLSSKESDKNKIMKAISLIQEVIQSTSNEVLVKNFTIKNKSGGKNTLISVKFDVRMLKQN